QEEWAAWVSSSRMRLRSGALAARARIHALGGRRDATKDRRELAGQRLPLVSFHVGRLDVRVVTAGLPRSNVTLEDARYLARIGRRYDIAHLVVTCQARQRAFRRDDEGASFPRHELEDFAGVNALGAFDVLENAQVEMALRQFLEDAAVVDVTAKLHAETFRSLEDGKLAGRDAAIDDELDARGHVRPLGVQNAK